MKIVISPAKSLDLDSKIPTQKHTEACFLKEAERLSKILKKKSPKSLGKLMRHLQPKTHVQVFTHLAAQFFKDWMRIHYQKKKLTFCKTRYVSYLDNMDC